MPASQGSSGGPTAPRPAPSRSSTPCRWSAASARSRAPRPSAIRSTSSPRRRPVRNSSGEPTALPPEPLWSQTVRPPDLGPVPGALTPFAGRLFFVADRRGARPGAVEQRRHRGRHAHPGRDRRRCARRRRPGSRRVRRPTLVRRRRRVPRRRAVVDRRHRGRHPHARRPLAGRGRIRSPLSLTPLPDRLLFTASDGLHGFELWQTNGTGGGTQQAHRHRPRAGVRRPRRLRRRRRSPGHERSQRRGRATSRGRCASRPIAPPGPGGLPLAPDGLAAAPLSTSAVRLSWRDNSSDEESFVVEASWPESGFVAVATAPAASTTVDVSGLGAGVPYTFRVRAENAFGVSDWSAEASATPFGEDAGPCAPSARGAVPARRALRDPGLVARPAQRPPRPRHRGAVRRVGEDRVLLVLQPGQRRAGGQEPRRVGR